MTKDVFDPSLPEGYLAQQYKEREQCRVIGMPHPHEAFFVEIDRLKQQLADVQGIVANAHRISEAFMESHEQEVERLRAAEAECRNSRGFVAAENERLRAALAECEGDKQTLVRIERTLVQTSDEEIERLRAAIRIAIPELKRSEHSAGMVALDLEVALAPTKAS